MVVVVVEEEEETFATSELGVAHAYSQAHVGLSTGIRDSKF